MAWDGLEGDLGNSKPVALILPMPPIFDQPDEQIPLLIVMVLVFGYIIYEAWRYEE